MILFFIGMLLGALFCYLVMKANQDEIVYRMTMQRIKDVNRIQKVNEIYHNPNLSFEEKFDKMAKAIFEEQGEIKNKMDWTWAPIILYIVGTVGPLIYLVFDMDEKKKYVWRHTVGERRNAK